MVYAAGRRGAIRGLPRVNYLYKPPVTQCNWEWGDRQTRFVSETQQLINY
jgi:hypothetical protein